MKRKTIEELQFCDDYMFKRVMQNEDICRQVIELILEEKISRVEFVKTEEERNHSYESKGIRLDVYTQLDDRLINVEMQAKPYLNLGRRIRYYQSSVDVDYLKRGMTYHNLPESICIFICCYDPCGLGLSRYDFEHMCIQNSAANLDIGTRQVILNTKGTELNIPDELKQFLRFVEDYTQTENIPLLEEMREAIMREKRDTESFYEYAQAMTHEDDAREDGRQEGRVEGRQEGIDLVIGQMLLDGAISSELAEKYRAKEFV